MAKKVGRKSKIDSIKSDQYGLLYRRGFTDKEVAQVLGVTEQTINNWKKKNQIFFESLKNWKEGADAKVEKSLYQRALGYKYDEVTYEKSKVGGLGVKLSKGEIEEIKHCDTSKVKIVTKEVVADVTAQIFWLKNRQPDKWRDVKEHKVDANIVFSEKIKAARERVELSRN